MNQTTPTHRPPAGFTLVEMLVVVAIIGILAGILLPVLARAKVNARKTQALLEMKQIDNAISAYESAYGRMPGSGSALGAGKPDFTFGTFGTGLSLTITNGGIGYQTNNSEIVAILMDLESYRNGNPTVNAGHARNPQKTGFLDGKAVTAPRPGIGDDGLYRDPWGNPYIITIDGDGDGVVYDGFYRTRPVSQENGLKGFNGLQNTVDPVASVGNNFGLRKKVAIWSFGPDGKADLATKANQGDNEDNVLSWK